MYVGIPVFLPIITVPDPPPSLHLTDEYPYPKGKAHYFYKTLIYLNCQRVVIFHDLLWFNMWNFTT